MRCALVVAAALACLLLVSMYVQPASGEIVNEDSMSLDSEMTSFLAEMESITDEPSPSASADLDEDAPTQKPKPSGSVQRGGIRKIRGPNFRKGAADGSTLPPYDPFGINWRHSKRQERRQAKVQERVEKENQRELCKAMQARARRRIANEKREAAEAKREAAAEAAKQAKLMQVETDLLETGSDLLMEVDAEAEADMDAEVEADAEMEVAMEAEQELDALAEQDAESEAEADEAETLADLAEMEADVEEGGEVDQDVEAEAESEAELAEAQSLMEKDAVEQVTPLVHRLKKRLHPSSHVTYGREALADETFDNKDSRAVFARRAHGREIVRFQRAATSSGGQAVVNGVTRTPCGKEITDKGLFGAVVLSNPGPTVEAANPAEPVKTDENIPVLKKLPVVPQFKEKKVVDEYGDA
jgi:chemotaxis protein histidine kinase CheA